MHRVVVTGSECTGKTTLAARLARRFRTARSLEFARIYAVRVARELTEEDVEPIARGQLAEEEAAIAVAHERGAALVVLDTDLLSTVVYARHYYGACPEWIEREAEARRADLHLLCHPDVPWSPDGVRDRPTRREEIHQLFEAVLAKAGARVVHLRGSWSERDATADQAVEELVR